MLAVVMTLTPAASHTSMKGHADDAIWQDVYSPSTEAGHVQPKLPAIDGVLIISLKEL